MARSREPQKRLRAFSPRSLEAKKPAAGTKRSYQKPTRRRSVFLKKISNSLLSAPARSSTGITGIGLDASVLENQELIELFYNFYNPQTVERGTVVAPQKSNKTMPPGTKQNRAQFGDVKKIIAPAGVQVFSNYLKIGDKFAKTFFVFSYPRYLTTGWFEPLINLPNLFDVSIFINPIDTGTALKNLRKKAGQLESQKNDEAEKGLVRNPELETAIQDIETLRDSLQQSEEKLFSTGFISRSMPTPRRNSPGSRARSQPCWRQRSSILSRRFLNNLKGFFPSCRSMRIRLTSRRRWTPAHFVFLPVRLRGPHFKSGDYVWY